MSKILPPISSYNINYPDFKKEEKINSGRVSSAGLSSYPNDSVSFKGTAPTKANRIPIKKIMQVIRDKANQKFVITLHKKSDIDAIAGALLFAELIEKRFNKTVNIVIERPLQSNYKFIDIENKIKVIGENDKIKDIVNKFGSHDVAISFDTGEPGRHDKKIFNALFKKARTTIDIDHHEKNKGEFANITLVDTSKKSGTLLAMEFLKSFGFHSKNITKRLSDLISSGMIGDSDNFKYVNNGLLKDSKILEKTSDFKKLSKKIFKTTLREKWITMTTILTELKTSKDGKIAYFIYDHKGRKGIYPEQITGNIISKISKNPKLEYFFGIITDSTKPNKKVDASIRSKAQPINQIINKLGGGGHEQACGLHKSPNELPPEAMKELLLTHLNNLSASYS